MTTEADLDRQLKVVTALRESGATQAELDALAAVWESDESGDTNVATVVTPTGHEVDAETAATLDWLEKRNHLPKGALMLEMAGNAPVPRDYRDILQDKAPSWTERMADLFAEGTGRRTAAEAEVQLEMAAGMPLPPDDGTVGLYKGLDIDQDLTAVRNVLIGLEANRAAARDPNYRPVMAGDLPLPAF